MTIRLDYVTDRADAEDLDEQMPWRRPLSNTSQRTDAAEEQMDADDDYYEAYPWKSPLSNSKQAAR